MPSDEGRVFPPPRVVTETWTPVEGPVRCLSCGHDHYRWQNLANGSNSLALWTWCDQEECPCRTLRSK